MDDIDERMTTATVVDIKSIKPRGPNRHQKRASASAKRKAPTSTVSIRLITEQLQKVTREFNQMQGLFFAVVKEQRRVRVAKADLEAIGPKDGAEAVDDGTHWIFEYRKQGP